MARAKTAKPDTTEPGTEVAVVETGNAALPSYLQGYTGDTGLDQIRAQDVAIPRLAMGQGTSPAVKDKSNDISEGDIYLNIDGTILAKDGEPLKLVVVGHSTEYMIWNDLKAGGGILARARKETLENGAVVHRWDQPNETVGTKLGGLKEVSWTLGSTVEQDGLGEWGTQDPENKKSPPAAQRHLNFVVYLPDHDLVASMSLARTYSQGGENLLGALKMGRSPIFARAFFARSDDRHDATNSWKVFKFTPAGYVPEDVFNKTKEMFEAFSSKGFEVDQSDGDQGFVTPDDGSSSEGETTF